MSVLFQETPAERQAITAMRNRLREGIASREMNIDDVAHKLGLVPDGVETLLRRPWSFEEAYRVAEALGFDFASALSES